MSKTVLEAYNLGTIQGARAIHMQYKVGSIEVGKSADFAIFDANSPAMICGAQHDPIAAIVLHSSPADIETVIVDGRIVKENGKLVPIELDERGKLLTGGKLKLDWADIARELCEKRMVLQTKIANLDMAEANMATMKTFRVDESRIVDHP